MASLACVHVAQLAWQQALAARPELGHAPAAVVAKDHPQARLLWCNPEARQLRLAPGLRLSQAQAVWGALAVVVADPARLAAARHGLALRLLRHTPNVEPDAHLPGRFWLDARGLTGLHGSLAAWGQAVRADLAAQGWQAGLQVGHNRAHLRVLAAARPGVDVWLDPAQERAAAAALPLAALEGPPPWVATLAALGLQRWGDFLALEAAAVGRRLGPAAAALHAEAHHGTHTPLKAFRPPPEVAVELELEAATPCAQRLLFACKGLLDTALGRPPLRQEGHWVQRIVLTLRLAAAAPDTPDLVHRLAPAQPCRRAEPLLELLRLRLLNAAWPAPVQALHLQLELLPACPQQLELLPTRPTAQLPAAQRALSQIVALWGEAAVTQAELRPAHLPEAAFVWQVQQPLAPPAPPPAPAAPPLVRRMFWPPRPLHVTAPPPVAAGQRLSAAYGRVTRSSGPFRLEGAWWDRPYARACYYLETDAPALLFVFYDALAQRWFVQGEVD